MRSETIKVVEQAVAILEQLAHHPGGTSITDLSESMGLGKSTVHRLLTALQNHGLVEQEPSTHRYGLGFRIVELSASPLKQNSLVALSVPLMKRIGAVMSETVSLHVLMDDRRLCVAEVESPSELKFTYGIGKSRPLHLGASGKCILAYLPLQRQEELMQRLTQGAPATQGAVGLEELHQDLEQVRRQGYSESVGEVARGVRGVAVPIFDRSGRVVASLGVVGPTFRLSESRLQEAVALLQQMAAQISTNLGFDAQRADAMIKETAQSLRSPS